MPEPSAAAPVGEAPAMPLTGVRVLDFSAAVAGPFTTMILADLGADVIKVEPPGAGDQCRNWGPFWGDDSCYFLDVNRNKRSVCVDLKSPDAREPIARLLERSDVVVENFRPGVMTRLGLDYAAVREIRPDVVYCSISAYGQYGPKAPQAGYDPTLQSLCGIMMSTGEDGRGPVRVGPSLVDKGVSLWSVVAILAALSHRRNTGEGQQIDASLLETAVGWMSYDILAYLGTGESPARTGSAAPGSVPSQVFETMDGELHVAAPSDPLWRRLCRAIGRSELAKDPRFVTNRERFLNRDDLIACIAPVLGGASRAHWLELLQAEGVPCAPVNTVAEALQDEQIRARQAIRRDDEASRPYVASPLRFSATPIERYSPAPALGADTDAVLAGELGLGSSEIARLRAAGAVA